MKESSTQLKKEIYLRNVSKRWKSELNTNKKVYILSPYITSNTAESVVENTQNCEIYTVFNVENFLIGTSSIKTLKNLINKGFKVYSVPQLHAKIILVVDTFVSIGSQNLTNQGTKNKEATFTSKDIKIVKFVEKEIAEWVKDSKEISLETIEFLERELKPLIKQRNHLKESIKIVEESVKTNEEELTINEQREINKLLLRNYIRRNTRRNNYIRGSVKKRGNNETFVPDNKYKNQLLNWRINFADVKLEKSYRYLAIIEHSGKLGWAKLNNNQTTYFGKAFASANLVKIISKIFFDLERSYKITFYANWDAETLKDYNLEILIMTSGLRPQEYFGCKVNAWFDLRNLKINFDDIQYFDIFGLKEWIEENRENVKEILEKELMKSFRYKEKNLQGVEADDFLHFGKKYKLTVGGDEKNHFLVFSEIP